MSVSIPQERPAPPTPLEEEVARADRGIEQPAAEGEVPAAGDGGAQEPPALGEKSKGKKKKKKGEVPPARKQPSRS